MADGGAAARWQHPEAFPLASPSLPPKHQEVCEMQNSLRRLSRLLRWNRSANRLLARPRPATKGCLGLGSYNPDARSQSVLEGRAATCTRKRECQLEMWMSSPPQLAVPRRSESPA